MHKKNKEWKTIFTEAYDGDFPCPNCLTAEKAYEMIEDEMPNENYWTPTFVENFDPRSQVLQQLEGNTGLPTLYHAGTIYAGRMTPAHYFGVLKELEDD